MKKFLAHWGKRVIMYTAIKPMVENVETCDFEDRGDSGGLLGKDQAC